MLDQDQKMTSGEEKVIYRGNKEPSPETRLPESPEAVDEAMPTAEDAPVPEATPEEAVVEGEASPENSGEAIVE